MIPLHHENHSIYLKAKIEMVGISVDEEELLQRQSCEFWRRASRGGETERKM